MGDKSDKPYPEVSTGGYPTAPPGEYSAGYPNIPPAAGQPAPYPGQPAPYAGQPAPYPGQPGPYPGQQGPYPGQPGIPMQPMAGQPGAMPPPVGGAMPPPVGVQPMPGGAAPAGAGWGPCPPAFTGFETNNKYEIRNSMGQRVYMAVEDTCCCTRNCCGSARPFDMKIMDNQKREVIHLSRPLRCRSCWCFCCLQKLTVEAPKGQTVGYVRQAWSCCHPRYNIKNAEDETQLRIKGPCFQCNMCGDIEFEVLSKDGETFVGQITKQWSGLAKEIFTDADNFGVSFPIDLDTKTKATLLGAVFLIDFMYFEHDSSDVKKEAKKLTD
ncbi:phospholipid scramblase [Elysia marginata]|uniref:Phospholipid scramblase n=1 Tax=Elysia marginata TaxID=1093978 RepID=A0AAV4EZB9_9GAST|nr:phospholipid scramblase [Elysia marginata]